MKEKEYDAIVIGSGCGMSIADEAMSHGLSVALVDKGPLGGTCPNLGCIPSKLIIYLADRIVAIQEAGKFGIDARIRSMDFNAVMERMRSSVREMEAHMRRSVKESRIGFYEGEGHFVSDYVIEVNGKHIKGNNIFIASGSRPAMPPIKGLDSVDCLTSDTVLALKERPDSLIIIGGGYIAVEYGHFFAAMGTRVTIIEMLDRLVAFEEPEISDLLKEQLAKRMAVHTGVLAQEVKTNGGNITVVVKDKTSGQTGEFTAQQILVATGRKSNADMLKLENTGVRIDERGFIKVNEYLETSQKNVFAVGDVNGQQMFTHMANRQASVVAHNALHNARMKVDFSNPPPHAVFSHPEIASVGLTEAAARKDHAILVGRADYFDVAYGEAMMEERGFAKAIVEKDTERILGFHIIGPMAPVLIQEVLNAMAAGGHIGHISAGIHIHPALPELIPRTLSNLEEVSN